MSIKNSQTKERTSILAQMKKSYVSYLFIAPYIIIFFTFTVLPVLISIFLSFTSFNMIESPRFIGIENYIRLFLEDSVFIKAIQNTLILAITTGPIGYLLCLLVAWIINELKPRLRAFITLIFYAPAISGNVYFIWSILFSGDAYGYINAFLLRYGMITQPIQFFKNPEYIMPLVVIVSLWTSLGTSFLAFIAGLQGIDKGYYEAGAIDGVKNRWQELWYITLPCMRPQLMFGAVMSITASFSVGAIVTSLAGFPSVDYAAHTIMNHLEDYGGMRYEMGYASAIAALLFVLMISINFIIKKILSKVGE